MTGYLGIDVGSISTNLVVMDDSGEVVAKNYLRTRGQPIQAVQQGLRETAKDLAACPDRRPPWGPPAADVLSPASWPARM